MRGLGGVASSFFAVHSRSGMFGMRASLDQSQWLARAGMPMNSLPPTTIKKLQALVQIAADLRVGNDYPITRLTTLKSFCADPDAAAKFALHIGKLTQKKMEGRRCPDHINLPTWTRYQKLATGAVRGMSRHLKSPTDKTKESLYQLLSEANDAQSKYERQRWGAVRIIQSMELLVLETAMECVLRPLDSAFFGYRLARQYAERYNPRFGTGLIPESAPMVDDIVDFWGRCYLGRGWKKRLGR